jgi:hypothetical protein
MRTKCITLYYEITCKFKKQIREIKKKKNFWEPWQRGRQLFYDEKLILATGGGYMSCLSDMPSLTFWRVQPFLFCLLISITCMFQY